MNADKELEEAIAREIMEEFWRQTEPSGPVRPGWATWEGQAWQFREVWIRCARGALRAGREVRARRATAAVK